LLKYLRNRKTTDVMLRHVKREWRSLWWIICSSVQLFIQYTDIIPFFYWSWMRYT